MPKKDKNQEQEEEQLWEEPFKNEPLPAASEPEPQPAKEYYTLQSWKGKVDVYMCSQCAACITKEDDMILHVVGHYPEPEKSRLLDELVQAKQQKEK